MATSADKLTYDQLLTLLGDVKGDADVKSCVSALKKEEVIFSPGSARAKDEVVAHYAERLTKVSAAQQNIDHSGLAFAIEVIGGNDAKQVGMSTVSTLTTTYCLFWDADTKGFITSYNYPGVKSSFTKVDKNYQRSVKRGFQVDAMMFTKGKLTKEWK